MSVSLCLERHKQSQILQRTATKQRRKHLKHVQRFDAMIKTNILSRLLIKSSVKNISRNNFYLHLFFFFYRKWNEN